MITMPEIYLKLQATFLKDISENQEQTSDNEGERGIKELKYMCPVSLATSLYNTVQARQWQLTALSTGPFWYF